jgi:ABC-type uncharacterized transport system permease subunit
MKSLLARHRASSRPTLAALLPFPIDLLLGRLTPSDALLGFATQLGWLGVALNLQHVIWHAGL